MLSLLGQKGAQRRNKLHSGIGDTADLTKAGIETLVDLPSVGKNLTDHPSSRLTWTVNSTDTFDTVLRNDTLFDELLTEWETTRTGLFTDKTSNHAGWLRLPSNSTFLQQYPDPASGADSAHYELTFTVCIRQYICTTITEDLSRTDCPLDLMKATFSV